MPELKQPQGELQPYSQLITEIRNLLPQAQVVHSIADRNQVLQRLVFSVPANQKIEALDLEKFLPNPGRIRSKVMVHDLDSLLDYTQRYVDARTLVWVSLDPRTFALSFTVQLDDHSADEPSWRTHSCAYTPRMSEEWNRWMGHNAKGMEQVEFATFLEDNLQDVTPGESGPSGTDMLKMALEFEARQDQRIKSHVRLQSGAIQLEYVAKDDDATVNRMQVFDRFAIGIPVFRGGAAWKVDARLRYRVREGKATFWYELIRSDKTHEAAAFGMISQLRAGLAGEDFTIKPLVLLGEVA
jgi:uncharacterized protein YfdQ (DUF2303 family)